MSSRAVTQVAVKGIERGLTASPTVYVLQVSWSDSTKYVIYRSHAEVFSMHTKLVEAFPLEAGKVSTREKILPDLARDDRRCAQEQAMANLALYFDRLFRLERKITGYSELVSLLTLTAADLAAAKDIRSRRSSASHSQSTNGEQTEEPAATGEVIEISGPLPLETYVVAASYKSKGKGEVSLNVGDMVDVVDKNLNGWWYVRTDDQEGWAPSTYLDSTTDDYRVEECPCLAGEVFLTTTAYTAQQTDELSFPCNASIEILNKIKDGWWIGSYNDKVGYVPSTYLRAYSDPYLDVKIRPFSGAAAVERPSIPVQRRNTIKGLKEKPGLDLTIYRKASEKNRTTRAVAMAATYALTAAVENLRNATANATLKPDDGSNGTRNVEPTSSSSTVPGENCNVNEKAVNSVPSTECSGRAGLAEPAVMRPRAADKSSRTPVSSRGAQLLNDVDELIGTVGVQ